MKKVSPKKRFKRNLPEFPPQEPKFIEQVHNKNDMISELGFKLLKKLPKKFFKRWYSNYIYQINFPRDSNLIKMDSFSFLKSHLYSITLPPSLIYISSNTFYGCNFLSEITFIKDDNNLKVIGNSALLSTVIKSIIIPSSIQFIGRYCFPSTLQEIEFINGAPNLIIIFFFANYTI